MTSLAAIRTILPLALTSGINFYLSIIVIGLSIRFGWVPNTPAGLEVLAAPPALITAGVLYVLEFFADKIEFVDNLWDLIHTFIRPVGAMALAAISLSGTDPVIIEGTAEVIGVSPQAGIMASLMAGVVALVSHSGKAGTRTVVNITSPFEMFSNIVISLLEDLAVAILAFLALRYPLTANVITVVILVVIIVFVPQLLRWAWFTLQAVLAWLRAFVLQVRQSDPLPPEHAALLNTQTPDLSMRCQAYLPRVRGRRGYASLCGPTLMFTYRAWFCYHAWRLESERMTNIAIQQQFLVNVLQINYHDQHQQARVARFVCTKDRASLIAQFVQRIHHHGEEMVGT